MDSVCVEDGNLVNYTYTGRDGYLNVKPTSEYNLIRVKNEFTKIASNFQTQTGSSNVALMYRGTSPSVLLSADALNSVCCGVTPLDPIVLQIFVPSKGNASAYRTYRYCGSLALYS